MAAADPTLVQRRRWVTLAVLCVSLLVVGIDNTILNVALPTLVRDLHASQSQLQWIVDAYAVVFAGLLLTAGSAGDRLGRKPLLALGLALFGAGSAASAFARSPLELASFRGFMGIGGALIMPATLSIITNVFTDPRERARAIGAWSATSGLGIAIGPIAGGLLLDHFWWGSVFLVNVPITAVGILGTLLLVPNSRDEHAPPPDPAGVALSILGLGSLLWGIIEAPTRGWSSSGILAAFAAAGVLLGAFVLAEVRSRHPMLRLQHFEDARFSGAVASVALVFFALFGTLFLLTQYLQFVLGYSALGTGLRVAPIAVALGVAAAVSPRLAHRLGTKTVVAGGLAVVAAGLWWLTSAGLGTGYPSLLGMLAVLGVGLGLALPPATDSIMGSLPLNEAGVGSATNGTMIQVGGALGVAVLGSVLQTRYASKVDALMAGHHVPPAIAGDIRSSIGGALAVATRVGGPIGAALRHGASVGYVEGMHVATIVATIVALAGVVAALLFLPQRATREAGAPTGSRRGAALDDTVATQVPAIPEAAPSPTSPRPAGAARPPAGTVGAPRGRSR